MIFRRLAVQVKGLGEATGYAEQDEGDSGYIPPAVHPAGMNGTTPEDGTAIVIIPSPGYRYHGIPGFQFCAECLFYEKLYLTGKS